MKDPYRYLPLVLYALTGFTGLLAEQGFEKYICLLVGATASASAVVIFAYFLGFAVGSSVAARFLKSRAIRHPLKIYGILELVAGISCLLFSYSFHSVVAWLAPFQAYYSHSLLKFAVRFAFGSILVLPTAALMGASFPLMAQVVDPHGSSSGRRWTQAYAWNLAGALVAALLGSYAIIPAIGIRGSFWLCFATTAFVFAVAVLMPVNRETTPAAREFTTATEPASRHRALGKDVLILLAASFTSGLVFFALEIIWTQLIAVAIGSSIYAFSSMLVMVLLGLLIGAFRVRRVLERGSAVVYSTLFQFCALLLVCQFRSWDMGQALFVVPMPEILRSFYLIELYKLLVAALLIVPAAALLGSIYPYLLSSPVLKGEENSYLVGYVNTLNSVGCLAGALLSIFFLIPVLGSEISLKVIVIGLIAVSMLFLWREQPRRKQLVRALLGSALVFGYTMAWRWDRTLLTSGLNVYFGGRGSNSAGDPGVQVSPRLLYFHEAAQGGMTTVIELKITENDRTRKIRTLYTNGKFEGNDGDEGEAQTGFSVIPSLFVDQFERALLIGLGTGHSALALRQIGYKEVDVAEFAPGIVSAADEFFSHLNGAVLKDGSVHLILEDGRNVLLTNQARSYDLITIELASIWFSGATNLYSTEFYELAKTRLRPGGVLQQWIQLHHISPKEVSCAIASARAAFPFVSLWYFGGQGLIVATDRPQRAAEERGRLLAETAGRLIRSGEDPARIMERIRKAELLTTPEVDRMLPRLKPIINTDHNRWIEYATPRYNWSDYDWRQHNLAFLASFSERQDSRLASAN